VASELHQGILKVWNAGPYTADVQLTGSLQLWLKSVPVARDIAGVEMVVGRRVAVALFDPTNPNDAAVLAVWV
jgi:hypothetical protein